jgi:hypothetical protein
MPVIWASKKNLKQFLIENVLDYSFVPTIHITHTDDRKFKKIEF